MAQKAEVEFILKKEKTKSLLVNELDEAKGKEESELSVHRILNWGKGFLGYMEKQKNICQYKHSQQTCIVD